ncbi:MAG: PilZ domain-containing protein, partial [Myxococcota bacterium]|nr:PilZ domain-containing protein [Myxococcota bacterium]
MVDFQDTNLVTGVVLLETGDHECVMLGCDGSTLRVRMRGEANLGKTIRLSFKARGLIRVLGLVTGTSGHGGDTEVRLALVALHSNDGMLYLEDFLSSSLSVNTPDPSAYQAGKSGYYYRFPKPSETEASEEAPEPAAATQTPSARREPRIAVRVTVTYKIHGMDRVEAQAYNVSSNGLYLLSEHRLPPIGLDVEVDYPIPLHDRPLHAMIVGEVVWAMDSMSSGQGGGLGIRINRVDDGAAGASWKQYVE